MPPSSLQTLAGELKRIASGEQIPQDQQGIATEIARQGEQRVRDLASWLEQRQPEDVVNEVRSFARRRPGTFLLGTLVAGLAVGRLTRSTVEANHEHSDSSGNGRQMTGATYGSSQSYVGSPVSTIDEGLSTGPGGLGGGPRRSRRRLAHG